MPEEEYRSTLQLLYDGIMIEPTPQIGIEKEPIYAGDNVIGFTYIVNIKGWASSVHLTDGNTISDITKTFKSLETIQSILQKNGKTLILKDCNRNNCLTAYGGHLKNFTVEEGQWVNYAKYNASLEFTDLFFTDIDGNSSYGIDTDTVAVQDTQYALDLLRIRSYTDKWNFIIPENEAYQYYARIATLNEAGGPVYAVEDYTQINVEYTITAKGKHYYASNDTTVASWESAKNFVQKKLYDNIVKFRSADIGVLSGQFLTNGSYTSNDVAVGNLNDGLTSSTFVAPVVPPILDRSITYRFNIFNEVVNCSTSEADGTFTATYSCVLKRVDPSVASPQNSIHTFTAVYDQTNDFSSSNRTITINGSVQGMLRTNILSYANDGLTLVLPYYGTFFAVPAEETNSKYGFAWEDFINYIGEYDTITDPTNPMINDLKSNFKNVLSINYASLFPNTSQDSPCVRDKGWNSLYQVLAEPKSFTVSHNYTQGTIDYTATYDTERSCAAERGFQSLTITEDDPVPIYAEHTVVGRTRGPILQNLNTNKAKNITIKFEGVTRKGCVAGHPFTTGYTDLDPKYQGISAEVCDTDGYVFLPPQVLLIYDQTEQASVILGEPMIRRSNNVTYNPVDGSYSIDRSYIVCHKKPNRNGCS